MVKGLSIKVASYDETIPKVLSLIKLDNYLKNHHNIVIKPFLSSDAAKSTSVSVIEPVVRYCLQHKNPGAEVFIAEGSDGVDTLNLFEEQGYNRLAERQGIGLIDLNKAESSSIGDNDFVGFENIMYPTILKDSFVISLTPLKTDEKTGFTGSVSNMLGAFPGKHYSGFFSSRKNKLDDYPTKYQIHDIFLSKKPNMALIDASDHGLILAGQSLEMDKHAAKLLGMDWKNIGYLRMLDETLTIAAQREASLEAAKKKE